MPLTRQCPVLKKEFVIRDEDMVLYDQLSPVFNGVKYPIPLPTLSPWARMIRRLSYVNDRFFARRKCNATGTEFISHYTPDSPLFVVTSEYYHSDAWDPLTFGQKYDFNALGFFDQYSALALKVPVLGEPVNTGGDNTQYSWTINSKNCYFAAIANSAQNTLYSEWTLESDRVINSAYTFRSSNIANCLYIEDSHNCTYIEYGKFLRDCHYSIDLVNCEHCLFCTNLRNKKFYIHNKQVSEVEFVQQKQILLEAGSYPRRQELEEQFEKMRSSVILESNILTGSENCVGDRNTNAKDCYMVFDGNGSENCHYSMASWDGTDSLDASPLGGDKCLEVMAGQYPLHCLFCIELGENCRNMLYSTACKNCESCFGCIGLKSKKFCILNIQYSEAEYTRLLPEIIAHMSQSGEWGEFFPASKSPFGYNQSYASIIQNLDQATVLDRGYIWSSYVNPPPKTTRTIPASRLPDALGDTPDDVCNWGILCKITGRPFKIIQQELDLYRAFGLSIPRVHPDERLKMRVARQRGNILHDRNCDNCSISICTPIGTDRPERVFCSNCYAKIS